MNLGEYVAEMIRAEGIDTVFGYIAEDNQYLMVSLDQIGIHVVHARHEQGATAMADGYSRATGKIGVVVVSQGPGVAQTGTALVGARKNGSRVLVIVPTASRREPHAIKRFDQEAYLKSTIGRVITVEHTEALLEEVRRAFQYVRSGTGPLALQIPQDILETEAQGELPGYVPSSDEPIQTHTLPSQAKLEQAAKLLASAVQPPVLIAGVGAVRSGARDAMIRLAETTGAFLATTLQATGLFDGHPYHLGIVGGLGHGVASEFAAQADCILVVGASLNPYTTGSGNLMRNAKIIQIDTNLEAIHRVTPVHLGMLGDARQTVLALNAVAEGTISSSVRQSREKKLMEGGALAAATPRLQTGDFPSIPGTLDPRETMRRLDRILPSNRLVISDAGHFMRWVIDGLTFQDPSELIWTAGFAAVGQGFGIAVGAAVGRPDRQCVLIVGDGGFMMAVQELAVAVQYRLPLAVLIWNDSTLGSEYHNLAREGRPLKLAETVNPEFAEVARAFGARAMTVRRLEELDAIADAMTEMDGPLVVDIKINKHVRHRSKGSLQH